MRIPITISIFSVIMIVGATISASIVSYSHNSQKESAAISTSEIMVRSAEILRLNMAALINPVEAIANLSPAWPGISDRPDENGHPLKKHIVMLLRNYSQISAISIGFEDGSFYLLGTIASRNMEKLKRMPVPPEAVFVEQIILRAPSGKARLIRHFLDSDGNTLYTNTEPDPKYDPRERPWYKAARDSDEVARSRVYRFSGSGKPGLTISRRHASGVIGVDITLDRIEAFLSREPQAEKGLLAVFSADGTVLAKAGDGAADDAALGALIEHVQSQPFFRTGRLEILGKPWIAHVSKAPLGADSDAILALALPVSVIAAPIIALSRNTVLMSLFIVLASTPFVWLVSRVLSRPLIRLARAADRIRHFDLSPQRQPVSIIDEIQQLQSAMSRMRHNLETFSLYVPKSLVRKLIERDEAPQLGGQRREITILFMDIENFTAMSADLEAEELMRRMSNYFEAVTRTLLEHGATIDKYMGDGLMAFWNAPDESPEHRLQACSAALAVHKVAAVETAKWQVADKPPLRTRIGLHCGEAVVGNVGSSDRMSYTAIGAHVNMAARLEAANRDLGTGILVSREIAEPLGEFFRFNPVGRIPLKGFKNPVEVFELISENFGEAT